MRHSRTPKALYFWDQTLTLLKIFHFLFILANFLQYALSNGRSKCWGNGMIVLLGCEHILLRWNLCRYLLKNLISGKWINFKLLCYYTNPKIGSILLQLQPRQCLKKKNKIQLFKNNVKEFVSDNRLCVWMCLLCQKIDVKFLR